MLVRNADSKVIGTLLVFRYDEGSSRAELGYVLGRSHWGQGLMREAIAAACSHAFAQLNLRRIEAIDKCVKWLRSSLELQQMAPEEVAKVKDSYTGQFLKKYLAKNGKG